MTLLEARNSGFMLMEDFQCLYEEIQQSGIFSDSKTFTDVIAKGTIAEILEAYHRQKQEPDFDLKSFVETFFVIPAVQTADYQSDPSKPLRLHLEDLWLILTRSPAKAQGTLIALPYDYVVPGGRFREIYYWDSYFTMLGLEVSGQYALIESMVNNFAHLIDTIGFIPNGNRTYYLGRSQPPFFALMLQLLARHKGEEVWQQYLPQLEKEYGFWMKGREELSLQYDYLSAQARTVMLPDGSVLNRYWDDVPLPRPEAYKEDVALAQQIKNQTPEEVYRHVRAAAESGWDFSSRWFKDGQNMTTIHTTDIIPVDLNCLLWYLEKCLQQAYENKGNQFLSAIYQQKATQRQGAIEKYCWNASEGFYSDYDWKMQVIISNHTLAGAFPLFFGIASQVQATHVAEVLEKKFLREGGLLTTLQTTHQQWDAPNGWAPLQWIAYRGLKNYGFGTLAKEIKHRWCQNNEIRYATVGKMMEKYNVEGQEKSAQGGEYPNQDGFGWTNGVYLKMITDEDDN